MSERVSIPRLPTSGQIIGALVKKLGIKHPNLQWSTGTPRRYFIADPERLVKDSSRDEIIGAIAEALTDSGFMASQQARKSSYEMAAALTATLQWHADNWDLLRAFLHRRSMSVLPHHLPKVWAAYVRLAVVDLAIRIAAHLHLAGSSPAVLDFLGWTGRKDRGAYLNKKRRQAGLSRKNFVDDYEVSNKTFDAWMYQGARPSDDNIMKISEALSARIEGSNPASIALELRALYWISDVAALLAEHIGDDAVSEAIGQLHRYAEETYRIIDEQFPAENRAANLTALANLGIGARCGTTAIKPG